MFDIEEELSKLPESPGVYIMKDSKGEVIYIGKAVILKNRVRQYFQSYRNHNPRVKAMVDRISEFEYIVTDSELEALILECNLIKRFRPRFNVLLKDDKTYPYIKITTNEKYPVMMIARKYEKDGAKYFGPYADTYAVRQTMDMVKKIFPIKRCNKTFRDGVKINRPCLNYHIHQCLAPCQGNVNAHVYNNMIKDVCDLLEGKQEQLISKLSEQMQAAATAFEYEKAAEIRDKINCLCVIAEKQKVSFNANTDRDIIAFARDEKDVCIQVFFVRAGKLVGRKHFFLENSEGEEVHRILDCFIKQFYQNAQFVPNEILVQDKIQEIDIIENWLSKKKRSRVKINVPQKGDKFKLVEMAKKNAEIQIDSLKRNIENTETFSDKTLTLVQSMLELEYKPVRIESYDVSNTGSSEMVAAMVVTENGKLNKKEYRLFKIKSVDNQNDYAAMQEAVFRRFNHNRNKSKNKYDDGFDKFPDLIFVDGGIGHVNAVKTVLNQMNTDIPVWGMAKDSRHKTGSLVAEGKEIELNKYPDLLKFITMIQDETHRFAIQYNKKLRSKRYTESVLDEIEGVGRKRKQALLKHFGSINKIKKATVGELQKVEGLNNTVAMKVHEYFNKRVD